MTRILMTFGDSNTHGTPPIVTRGVYDRYGPDIRWPRIAVAALGDGWELVEEGLPGRTAQFPDPLMGAHMDARDGLKIALQSHGPLDVLTLMLGTNDTKTMFGATPEGITAGIAGLLSIAMSDEMQTRHGGFKVLVICPPPVLEQGPLREGIFGGRAKGMALPPLYAAMAENWGAGFLDAGQHIAVSPVDGVHFEPDAHRTLGLAVAKAIEGL
ncbi:MAG: lipolytic enzyme, G-D-S-L [Limimaricola sp.]|uniref:GDSL-type esterase/lipase family protein n=1 Tax=Limimaricola sp. TaxID=2211665 RepID=UPI001DB21554|nr:GDSL-type esterase/lipase family protein [Limimaricola sp.]MBI1416999.1 lipolytic enzyme, G-D-S-L [Limimaricola sp.]